MSKIRFCPNADEQQLVHEVQIQLAQSQNLARLQSLLRRHHYLGMVRPVGERLFYIAVDGQRRWVGVLVFCAAAKYRTRIGSYPLWSLLTIVACAMLCGAQRGPKALAGFAKKLSQAQRRALDIRPDAHGGFPAPSQPTFSRLIHAVSFDAVNRVALEFQTQVRGQPPKDDLIALDGKEPKHGGGHSVLTAVAVPSQYYLGSAMVDRKTNEIPVARQLFQQLNLEGRLVSLDALHTQTVCC
jgi:hypothetical protein